MRWPWPWRRDRDRFLDQRDELLGRITKALTHHQPQPRARIDGVPVAWRCTTCPGDDWPCPTRRDLDPGATP